MIAQIMKDPWAYISTGMIIAVQWVMAHVNFMMGVIMGIGGVITLVYRVKADRKKAKILDLELRQQELEFLIKQHEYKKLNQTNKENEQSTN